MPLGKDERHARCLAGARRRNQHGCVALVQGGRQFRQHGVDRKRGWNRQTCSVRSAQAVIMDSG